MYICIDVGGTKTLVACLDDNGVIIEQTKLPTPSDYQDFVSEVGKSIDQFIEKDFTGGAVGLPALQIDRENGVAFGFGNLPWRNVSVATDLEALTNCPIFVEGDAKLAGLSEAMLVKDQFSKVLYITIGTGIGYSVIEDQKIDVSVSEGGGHIMLVNRGDALASWESVISGRIISERYGKMAKDIDDKGIWEKISKDLAIGVIELVSIFAPEVIIFGGGVGSQFNKFGDFLKRDLDEYQLPLITMPELRGAGRAEEAVVYGCYDYAKQRLQND